MARFGAVSMSGLLGGDDAAVRGVASEDSSSDRFDEVGEVADLGKRSGALYESMLVVWTSSTGAEILLRMELSALVVLLRLGRLSESPIWMLCLTRRVVNALPMLDILAACSYALFVLSWVCPRHKHGKKSKRRSKLGRRAKGK